MNKIDIILLIGSPTEITLKIQPSVITQGKVSVEYWGFYSTGIGSAQYSINWMLKSSCLKLNFNKYH